MKIITPPVLEQVLTLDELHLQCKMGLQPGDTHPEDALLWRALASARARAQHETNRAVGEQTVEIALDAFPAGGIALPLAPYKSIASVRYVDAALVEQTLPTDAYTVDDYRHPAWLLPAAGTSWPEAAALANAVKVRYVCGDVPEATAQAMLLIVGSYHRHKQEVTDRETHRLWAGVETLLSADKVWGF